MPALFADEPAANGPYLVYDHESTIEWNGGVLELPVAYMTGTQQNQAGPGFTIPFAQRQAVEAVQVAAPYGYRTVTYRLLRWGAEPQMPDPTPGPYNEVLKFARWTIAAPVIQPDGVSFMQSARGIYIYILLQPPWAATDPLPGVSTPASTDTGATNHTDPSQFVGALKGNFTGGLIWSG